MMQNGGNSIEAVYARYLASLLQGDKGECIRIVSGLDSIESLEQRLRAN